MMDIAVEIAMHDDAFEDTATRFFEHFVLIAEAFVTELLKAKLPLTTENKSLIIQKISQKFTKRSYAKLITYLEKFEI